MLEERVAGAYDDDEDDDTESEMRARCQKQFIDGPEPGAKDYEVKLSSGLPVTHNLGTPSPYNGALRYGDGSDSKQTATALQHGQAAVGAPFNQLSCEDAPLRL